jgi:hypothetical protein
MKRSLLLLSAVVVLSCFNHLIAQSKKDIKDSTSVIIFNSSSSTTSKPKKGSSSESTIIKIAPLGVLSGTFPVLVEQRITDFLSVQAAAGVTHRNYVRTLIRKEESPEVTYSGNGSNLNDVSERINSFEFRTPKLGFMASIQPRIYYASEGLDGGFIGLSFDYYRYNFQIPAITGSTNDYKQNGSMKSEHEILKDYMVHFGYQSLSNRISIEYSTAIGLRSASGNKYIAGYNNSGILEEGEGTYKQTGLNFNIGFKVGYHF